LQGLIGEGRIAGAQDMVWAKIHRQFFFQGFFDVDLSQDSEALRLESFGDSANRLLKGNFERFTEIIGHEGSFIYGTILNNFDRFLENNYLGSRHAGNKLVLMNNREKPLAAAR